MGSQNSKPPSHSLSTNPPAPPNPEYLEYFPKFLISANKKLHIHSAKHDETIQFNIFDESKISDLKISKIVIDKIQYTVVHYFQENLLHFIYYDPNLNYYKKSNYKYSKTEYVREIYLIRDDEFLCRMGNKLLLIDIKNNWTRTIYSDRCYWFYRLDSDKNIIICRNIQQGKISLFIRTYSIATNYKNYTMQPYSTRYHIHGNHYLEYVTQLNAYIISVYEHRKSRIAGAYYNETSNTYSVIFYNIILGVMHIHMNQWNYDGDTWRETLMFKDIEHNDLYELNFFLNQDEIHLMNYSVSFCSVLVENYSYWHQRTHQFISEISCLNKFSDDLLLLLLSYIN